MPLALDRVDAAIVNADVPERHWQHSPAENLVAVSIASTNGVGVARVKAHKPGFMEKSVARVRYSAVVLRCRSHTHWIHYVAVPFSLSKILVFFFLRLIFPLVQDWLQVGYVPESMKFSPYFDIPG